MCSRGKGETHGEKRKMNEKVFSFELSPRNLVGSRKELIAVKACQSPDSWLQSPGANVIIANQLKSLTVTIASEKTPTPKRKNQWQQRKKKKLKGKRTMVIPS